MASKKDGFGVRIILETSGITFKEKSVTPPGYEGQDPVDVTNNSKTSFREKYARALVELSPASGSVEFDPSRLSAILAAINVHQFIRLDFPEGDALGFYGFLRNFVPDEMGDGEAPVASVELVPCGVNAAGAEEGVVYYTTTTPTTTTT